jgi:hypothetical protein
VSVCFYVTSQRTATPLSIPTSHARLNKLNHLSHRIITEVLFSADDYVKASELRYFPPQLGGRKSLNLLTFASSMAQNATID